MKKPGMAQADLRRVSAQAERLRKVQAEFEAAVLDAHRSGETMRDIATAAGRSHQGISNIIRRLRPN